MFKVFAGYGRSFYLLIGGLLGVQALRQGETQFGVNSIDNVHDSFVQQPDCALVESNKVDVVLEDLNIIRGLTDSASSKNNSELYQAIEVANQHLECGFKNPEWLGWHSDNEFLANTQMELRHTFDEYFIKPLAAEWLEYHQTPSLGGMVKQITEVCLPFKQNVSFLPVGCFAEIDHTIKQQLGQKIINKQVQLPQLNSYLEEIKLFQDKFLHNSLFSKDLKNLMEITKDYFTNIATFYPEMDDDTHNLVILTMCYFPKQLEKESARSAKQVSPNVSELIKSFYRFNLTEARQLPLLRAQIEKAMESLFTHTRADDIEAYYLMRYPELGFSFEKILLVYMNSVGKYLDESISLGMGERNSIFIAQAIMFLLTLCACANSLRFINKYNGSRKNQPEQRRKLTGIDYAVDYLQERDVIPAINIRDVKLVQKDYMELLTEKSRGKMKSITWLKYEDVEFKAEKQEVYNCLHDKKGNLVSDDEIKDNLDALTEKVIKRNLPAVIKKLKALMPIIEVSSNIHNPTDVNDHPLLIKVRSLYDNIEQEHDEEISKIKDADDVSIKIGVEKRVKRIDTLNIKDLLVKFFNTKNELKEVKDIKSYAKSNRNLIEKFNKLASEKNIRVARFRESLNNLSRKIAILPENQPKYDYETIKTIGLTKKEKQEAEAKNKTGDDINRDINTLNLKLGKIAKADDVKIESDKDVQDLIENLSKLITTAGEINSRKDSHKKSVSLFKDRLETTFQHEGKRKKSSSTTKGKERKPTATSVSSQNSLLAPKTTPPKTQVVEQNAAKQENTIKEGLTTNDTSIQIFRGKIKPVEFNNTSVVKANSAREIIKSLESFPPFMNAKNYYRLLENIISDKKSPNEMYAKHIKGNEPVFFNSAMAFCLMRFVHSVSQLTNSKGKGQNNEFLKKWLGEEFPEKEPLYDIRNHLMHDAITEQLFVNDSELSCYLINLTKSCIDLFKPLFSEKSHFELYSTGSILANLNKQKLPSCSQNKVNDIQSCYRQLVILAAVKESFISDDKSALFSQADLLLKAISYQLTRIGELSEKIPALNKSKFFQPLKLARRVIGHTFSYDDKQNINNNNWQAPEKNSPEASYSSYDEFSVEQINGHTHKNDLEKLNLELNKIPAPKPNLNG